MRLLLLVCVVFFQKGQPVSDTLDMKTMLQGCWKQQSDPTRFMCIKADSVRYYFNCILKESGNLIFEFPGDGEAFYDNQGKAYDFTRGQEFNFAFKLLEVTLDSDTITLGSVLYLDDNNLEVANNAGSVSFKKVDKKTCW